MFELLLAPDRPLPGDLELLDPEERARWAAFLFEADRERFLAAHALLRRGLSRHTAVAPQDWRFVREAHGRPRVYCEGGLPERFFSLSHTRGLVAVLLCSSREAGVDVEELRAIPEGLLHGGEVLSVAERVEILALPPAERADRFFSLWCLKEAYAKARGLGLALSPAGINPRLRETTPEARLYDLPDDDPSWSLALLPAGPGHRLAVAILGISDLTSRLTNENDTLRVIS